MNITLWTKEQFDILSFGTKHLGLGSILFGIAYCLDADEFDVKMLSGSFDGLIENITVNSNTKKKYVENITKQIQIMTCDTHKNNAQAIEFLIKKRDDYILHTKMNDIETERLMASNDAGEFDHIYLLLDEKYKLKMLILQISSVLNGA